MVSSDYQTIVKIVANFIFLKSKLGEGANILCDLISPFLCLVYTDVFPFTFSQGNKYVFRLDIKFSVWFEEGE